MDKMKQANELRMGNWIDMGREGICQVTGYNIYMIYLTCNGAYTAEFYKEIKPIPLTEEWLLKFDFIQQNVNGETVFIFKDNEWYFIENVASNGWASLYCNGIYCATDIQYVHQLQNLYFALTGEELTIKTI